MTTTLARMVSILGFFMVFGCGWALLFVRPGTGDFVIAVFGVALGALIVTACVVVIRRDIRRTSVKEEK